MRHRLIRLRFISKVLAVHFLWRKENEPNCVRHTVSHYVLARNLSDYKSFGLEIAKIS